MKLLFKFNDRLGFTLIEIMIVIGILGILATAGYASFLGSQKNARDSRRKVDLETIRQALELYRLDNGQYPFDDPFTTSCDSSLGFVVSNALGCAAATGGDWSASLGLKPALVPNYLSKLPIDPINKFGSYSSDSSFYNYVVICDYAYKFYCGGENQVTRTSFDCTGKGCCAYGLDTRLESTKKAYSICSQ